MSAPERRKIVLGSREHRAKVGAIVADLPPGCVVTIDPPRRTIPQNARLHAMLSDVAASGTEWAGCQRTAEEWKVIFVSGHAAVEGRDLDVICGLEGEPVALRESTAVMSKERLGSLMEYISAWCAAKGIVLHGERDAA